MYYAMVCIISLSVHLIINYQILINHHLANKTPALVTYRHFLIAVIFYYFTDILWEILAIFESKKYIFYETEIYYVVMAITLLFWTKFVIDYIKKESWFSRALKYAGWIFLIAQLISLTINLFYPIAFWFDEKGTYHTENARNINLLCQFIMFLATSLYMTAETLKSKEKIKHRYRAIEMFGIVMTIFVTLQGFFPLLPFYAIGILLGTCLIHTFVLEDERTAREEELERLLKVEEIQEAELSSTRHMAFTDPLTGVKSKGAYQEDALCIESKIENHDLKDFGLILFDVNDLKKTNDSLGHEEGDKIIKSAAKLICQVFKHSPVYRIGGDEFVTFLTGEDMINRNKLIKSFNRLIEKNKKEGKVTVACGYSSFNSEKDTTFAQIFGRADAKMYERKKQLKESS